MRERTDHECGLGDFCLYAAPNIFVFLSCIAAMLWNYFKDSYGFPEQRILYHGYEGDGIDPQHINVFQGEELHGLT